MEPPIRPCKILRKFSNNAYEIEIIVDIKISPIFNVSYLGHYVEDEATQTTSEIENSKDKPIKWVKQITAIEKLEMERILDK